MRRLLAVVVLCVLLVTAAGCSRQDGRELPPPRQAGPAASAPEVGEAGQGSSPVSGFVLVSPAVASGGELPARFTCLDEALSPPLRWRGTPPAAELAVVARDLDAGGTVHWAVTGIDPVVEGFGDGGLPEGASVGPGGAGGTGWSPPCAASGTHRFQIVLHALPTPLEVDPSWERDDLAASIEQASNARAVLDVLIAAR